MTVGRLCPVMPVTTREQQLTAWVESASVQRVPTTANARHAGRLPTASSMRVQCLIMTIVHIKQGT